MKNDNFLRACKREKVSFKPVWFMRQAGRYLPIYRALKKNHDVLTLCKNPELMADISIAPVKELKVDACIIFADIMLLPEAMKVSLEIKENFGPIVHKPINSMKRFRELEDFSKEYMDFFVEGIKLTKKRLENKVPLIGLSGAPFTLASYLIEGEPSRSFLRTKETMYSGNLWSSLMEKLTYNIVEYLNLQIESGVDAVQIFDSWVGCLSPRDYRDYVLPYTKEVFKKLKGKVPTIHFSEGSSSLLELINEIDCDVISLDWRIDIGEAWERVDYSKALQGNLDPACLFAKDSILKERVKEILYKTSHRYGHIFNLGHGVLSNTNPKKLKKVVKWVHEYKYE